MKDDNNNNLKRGKEKERGFKMYTKLQIKKQMAGLKKDKLAKKTLRKMIETNMSQETIDKAVLNGFYFIKKILTNRQIELTIKDSATHENLRGKIL